MNWKFTWWMQWKSKTGHKWIHNFFLLSFVWCTRWNEWIKKCLKKSYISHTLVSQLRTKKKEQQPTTTSQMIYIQRSYCALDLVLVHTHTTYTAKCNRSGRLLYFTIFLSTHFLHFPHKPFDLCKYFVSVV